MTGDDRVLASARAAAGVARDNAAAAEEQRRLPRPVVDTLRDAGLFRMCVPRAVGGLECEPATLVSAIEAVARGDGAAGWCLMIGATSGLVAAWLPRPAAEAVYGDPAVVAGGVFAPMGGARAVDGGVVLDGRWAWGSGSQHCDWLMFGCIVEGSHRLALLPATEVEITDTWWSAGLRGTGSHDLVVRERFVPFERMSAIAEAPVTGAGAPLYAFPVFGLLATGIAAVALGIGRAALDELLTLAGAKVPTFATRKLGQRAAVQSAVARAEALLRGARSFLDDAVGEAWDSAVGGGAIPPAERAALRLAATSATRWSAEAVDLVHDAAGGTAVQERAGPIARCFRDIHTVTQHAMVASPSYEAIGRALLGGEEPSL